MTECLVMTPALRALVDSPVECDAWSFAWTAAEAAGINIRTPAGFEKLVALQEKALRALQSRAQETAP